jgi:hypothetical protein
LADGKLAVTRSAMDLIYLLTSLNGRVTVVNFAAIASLVVSAFGMSDTSVRLTVLIAFLLLYPTYALMAKRRPARKNRPSPRRRCCHSPSERNLRAHGDERAERHEVVGEPRLDREVHQLREPFMADARHGGDFRVVAERPVWNRIGFRLSLVSSESAETWKYCLAAAGGACIWRARSISSR